MSCTSGPKIADDGLVMYLDAANLKSYPSSGTIITDISGTGNNGFFPYLSEFSCSELSFAGNGYNNTCGESDPCSGVLTFEEALEYAHDMGGRLPTLDEILNNAMGGSGCGYDNQIIWSCDKGANDFEHWCAKGINGTGTEEIRSNSSTAYVRFVSDIDLNRTDPVLLDDSVIKSFLQNYNGNNNPFTMLPTLFSYTTTNNGSFVFNGLTSHISIPFSYSTGPYSVLQWVRPSISLADSTSSGSRRTPLVGPGPQWSPGYWLVGRLFRVHAFTEYRDITIDWVGDTSWHQIGQIFDGTTCYHILDGEILLGTRTSYSPGSVSTLLIGAENTTGNNYNWNGDISITSVYNKVLTETEVKQNFNALRGRYNL